MEGDVNTVENTVEEQNQEKKKRKKCHSPYDN